MKYAFSSAGITLLKKHGGDGSLLAFDYDGTLAPMKARPKQAGIPASTLKLLQQLSLLAPTAAITGRPLSDIRTRVPTTLRGWAGNHGAEIFPPYSGKAPPVGVAKRRVHLWSEQLRAELLGLSGVFIEEKDLSLSVHYRASPNRPATLRLILAAVARLHPGPRALAGKCVVNLLVPELPHKGQAVQNLLQAFHLHSAVYVGDDENDEDVFALSDPRVCSVRVGKRPNSRAALYLKRQSEINRLLRLLLSLRGPPKSRYLKQR
jgi:trehalose 6-phosphate phosphatase